MMRPEAPLLRRLVTVLVVAAGLACLLIFVAPRLRSPATHAPANGSDEKPADLAVSHRLSAPIVLIGLDGADWQIIDPLIEAGRLPALASLKKRGAWGHLRSFEPILSPLLWTTAATGKPPDQHGIVDFLVADERTGAKSPITSRSRKVKALWNIFSDHGLSADVIAWWATWPAEPIHGRIVSDRVAYSLFSVGAGQPAGDGLTHPEALWDELRPLKVSDAEIGYDRIARFLDVGQQEFQAARQRALQEPERAYREPINHLAKILASTETYHRAALAMLQKGQPDLFAIYYQGIDEVCHRFMHFGAPRMPAISPEDFARYRRAVEEFYVYQDELLGDLVSKVSPDSTILVMSDHGFVSGSSRPTDGPADIEGKPGKWHRLYGIVILAGQGIPPGRFDTATLYDIAPTILTLAGLPTARDMMGTALLRRATPATGPVSIASYESEEPVQAGAANEPGTESAADEELMRNLASLGYIGGAPPAQSPATAAAPDPGTVTAHTNLASTLLQKGDLAGAESQLRAALASRPSYFPALITLSQVLVRAGRVDEALATAQRAVSSSQDAEIGAYVHLALLAERAGQVPKVSAFLETLPRKGARAAGIETALGMLASSSDPAAAERHLRAALMENPTSPEAMGRLFDLYRRRGQEAELEPLLRAALDKDGRSVMHHNWLGLVLMRRGELAGAEAEFKEALNLAPDFGGTMANLGSLYGRTGRLEEAVTVLTRAVRIEPKNLEARVNLGASLAKLGRLDEAIASLEEARRSGMKSPDLLNAMGLAYAQKGETLKAREALKESLSLSPGQPQVEALLSDLSQ